MLRKLEISNWATLLAILFISCAIGDPFVVRVVNQ